MIKPARQRRNHLGRRLRFEGTRWACPHCQVESEIRTSRMLTATLRETMYACTNVECGHTYVVMAEVVRTLSPSATPNLSVVLPLSSHVQRAQMRAVLDCAGEAEHQALFTRPTTADLFTGGP